MRQISAVESHRDLFTSLAEKTAFQSCIAYLRVRILADGNLTSAQPRAAVPHVPSRSKKILGGRRVLAKIRELRACCLLRPRRSCSPPRAQAFEHAVEMLGIAGDEDQPRAAGEIAFRSGG